MEKVGEDGFEPSKLKNNRFTVCPLWPLGNSPILSLNGAGGRTRTPDLLITNQLLYQLSYTSTATIIIISQFYELVKCFFKFFKKVFYEAGGRTRTPDLLITNQLLYQLSYTSIQKVEATGLEPAASWSQTKHSTKLSYASFCHSYQTASLL